MGSPQTTVDTIINDSRFCEMLNIGPTDDRVYSFLNEACNRLLKRGRYWGTTGRYVVAATSQLISNPPQIDTIEKIAVSHRILPLHDLFYEFLDYGWGTRDDTLPNGSGIDEVLERGSFPTMVDISSTGSFVTVKCDLPTDVGKQVRILGYDNATPPNWVRTLNAGVYEDGEVVSMIQGSGMPSLTSFSRITGIQVIQDLDGQWWLYQGTISGTLLSNYQYWEKTPSYKRYLIPFVNSTVSTVELIGKLAFRKVSKPFHYPVIQNVAALKLAARAIKAEEESSWVEANILWNGGRDRKTGQNIIGAMQELELELDHHLGAGRRIGLNISTVGPGDPVEALF